MDQRTTTTQPATLHWIDRATGFSPAGVLVAFGLLLLFILAIVIEVLPTALS